MLFDSLSRFLTSLPHLVIFFLITFFISTSFPIMIPFISTSLPFLTSNRALRSFKSRSMGVYPATTLNDFLDAVRYALICAISISRCIALRTFLSFAVYRSAYSAAAYATTGMNIPRRR